jgi:Peptidase family M28
MEKLARRINKNLGQTLVGIRRFSRVRCRLWLVLLLATSLAFAAPTSTQLSPADPQGFLNDVKTLTQPKREGRGDGLKGLTRAQHVIVDRYKSLGLQPAGTKEYLQPFTVSAGAKLRGKNHILVQNVETKTALKLDQDYAPFSFYSSGGVETLHAKVNSVFVYLLGKTDEYVIVGAHCDHLGRGTFDSLAPSQIGQIYPGADDNASGTAGVLELARILAPLKGQFQRGILSMSFAEEELGLLGSAA